MRITPLDVRKQEFRKAVRGFDSVEVKAFLETLADEYEAVLVDNKVLRERLTEQDEKITEYQTMEKTLRDTLMTAERVMQETRDNATREGELVIQEAHMKSRTILDECRSRTEELRREMMNLHQEKENYIARFRSLAEAQIKFVDTHKDDFSDLDDRLIQMADSVVDRHTEGTTVKVKPIQTRPVGTGDDQWRDYTPSSGRATNAASLDPDIVGPAPEKFPEAISDTVEVDTVEADVVEEVQNTEMKEGLLEETPIVTI